MEACLVCMIVAIYSPVHRHWHWPWQPGGVQNSLKPAAILSLVVYTVGLPATFLFILVRHRRAIFMDQVLYYVQ